MLSHAPTESERRSLEYVRQELKGLRQMVSHPDDHLLNYLLDLAENETARLLKEGRTGAGEVSSDPSALRSGVSPN